MQIFFDLISFILSLSSSFAADSSKVLDGFNNDSRAGVVLTTGNSKSKTFDLSQKNSYEWNSSKIGLLSTYMRTVSSGVESARRWSLGLRYDYLFTTQWAAFISELVEGDKYAGFKQRYSTDIGGKYSIIKNEKDEWLAETGYRHQLENQTNGKQTKTSFVRLFSQFEHKWNKAVSTKLWIEFLQNLRTNDDRFINSELSQKAALTEIFSVQLAYLVRYRKLPPVGVGYKTDTMLTAALLAHF